MRFFSPRLLALSVPILFLSNVWGQEERGWWMREPLRLIQTNLRETDSDLDPVKLAEQLKSFPANTLLFSVGGIVAHYALSHNAACHGGASRTPRVQESRKRPDLPSVVPAPALSGGILLRQTSFRVALKVRGIDRVTL